MADLLQGLKDAVNNEIPESSEIEDDPTASIEKLLKALNDMPGLSEEDKAELVKSLSQGGMGDAFEGLGKAIENPWLEFLILFGLISLIVLLLSFIGYKLYNGMVQREKRREMKKLKKEQKKRK